MIRHAVRGDLSAIVAIYNESVASRLSTADDQPVSVKSRETWFAGHSPDAHPILVSEREDALAGWTSLQPFYGRPAYRATAEISTYVAGAFQRRGVGSELRTAMIDRCPQLGIATLLSFVFEQNTASVALNRKFDFAIWGRLPGVARFADETRDLLIMGRHL